MARDWMRNTLHNSRSPYLLQHADNPVWWHEWDDEVFQYARRVDRPVFVSIGYSTCHWCHVMAKESFADEDIARLLNERFVSIKVDREERPDLDAIYMKVCQGLTGHGGWPLNVFLTPEGKPFYAGTYFPPKAKWDLPGFQDVIVQLYEQYQNEREKIENIAEKITISLEQLRPQKGYVEQKTIHRCFEALQQQFDSQYGGFGAKPKFPSPHLITFLLCYWRWTGNPAAMNMAQKTLDTMAKGGIFDQIGYGFCRYAVDRRWIIPHFEKMLYDQATLLNAYSEAYLATGEKRYHKMAQAIVSFIESEMQDESGGFYSAIDADSEGEEGKYYLWSREEVFAVLGEEKGALFCDAYGMTGETHFNGKYIPNRLMVDQKNLCRRYHLDIDALDDLLEEGRQKLLHARSKRIAPGKDRKILTSWNAYMIQALARAGRGCREDSWIKMAERAYSFLEKTLIKNDHLMARYAEGEVKYEGYLDDYAALTDALIALYEATLDEQMLNSACAWADRMIERFYDEKEGGFYFTAVGGEKTIVRPKETVDGALPSGNSIAVKVLFRLARLTGESSYADRYTETIRGIGDDVSRYPTGHAALLQSVLLSYMNPKEVVVIGEKGDSEYQKMLQELKTRYIPEVVYIATDRPKELSENVPYIKNFSVGQKTMIYVCEQFSCQAPTSNVRDALKELEKS